MASLMPSSPSDTARRSGQGPARAIVVGLQAVSAVACAVASVLHAGMHVTVGGMSMAEPPIAAASIVEGAVAVAQAIALWAVLSRQAWAQPAAVGAFGFGVVGFLVGITAVVRNPSMQTPFNVGVHVLVLPLLAIGLALALSGAGRRALARTAAPSAQGQRVPH